MIDSVWHQAFKLVNMLSNIQFSNFVAATAWQMGLCKSLKVKEVDLLWLEKYVKFFVRVNVIEIAKQ